MRKSLWLLMALILAIGLSAFMTGCNTGGGGGGNGGNDDTADDDAGDDDASGYCGTLTDQELNLFKTIFCAGSSNSYSDDFGTPPFTADDLFTWYHGKIVTKAMEKMGPCVDYVPALWVYWYTDVGQVQEATTLSWAIDAFYHFLDDDPAPMVFGERVHTYLETLFGGMNDGVFFIGANIPKVMMLDYTGDKNEILQIIYDEMTARPYAIMIDLNYYMEKLIAGKVYYNGEKLSVLDILIDQVHVNELGHQVLADLFIQTIDAIWPELQIPTWGTIEIMD